MDNDQLRELDRLIERINVALASDDAEVLEWHPEDPGRYSTTEGLT